MLARLKTTMLKLRIVGSAMVGPRQVLRRARFRGSAAYWEDRYRRGGTSGIGSSGALAAFKAKTLNEFVEGHGIQTVIEFGCGDGNQLALARYPHYVGLDVSRSAIVECARRFDADETKSFFYYDPRYFVDKARLFRAELALSLDVVFHLVEDTVFERHMRHLFAAADRFVVVYSSDVDRISGRPHERHRAFTKWIDANINGWTLVQQIENPVRTDETSESDFYVYRLGDPTSTPASQGALS